MSSHSVSPVQAPPHILAQLNRLHDLSTTQEAALGDYLASDQKLRASNPSAPKIDFDDLMRDKFIALDKDKCEFVYQLIRAKGATSVVEAGTSFGVSTIYLALAVGQNSEHGMVIATEKEESKAARARENWKEAGKTVEEHIDLREGDLLETLKDIPEVDLLLLDSKTLVSASWLSCADDTASLGTFSLADVENGRRENEAGCCCYHGQQHFFCGEVQRSSGVSERTGKSVHESHFTLFEWSGDERACSVQSISLWLGPRQECPSD